MRMLSEVSFLRAAFSFRRRSSSAFKFSSDIVFPFRQTLRIISAGTHHLITTQSTLISKLHARSRALPGGKKPFPQFCPADLRIYPSCEPVHNHTAERMVHPAEMRVCLMRLLVALITVNIVLGALIWSDVTAQRRMSE